LVGIAHRVDDPPAVDTNPAQLYTGREINPGDIERLTLGRARRPAEIVDRPAYALA
jgi:hypothetical protein